MQPVSPIPHLPPSASIRSRHPGREGRAFRTDLTQAVSRLADKSPNPQPQAERTRSGADSPGRPQAVRSLLGFERPRVHRYGSGTRKQPETQSNSTDPAVKALSGSALLGADVHQVKETAKGALRRRIHAVARRLGVDPSLSEAIARAESGLDQTARSPDGRSEGAFQMKRTTATEMQQRLKDDPAGLSLSDEVTLGIGYLRYLDRLFATQAVLDDAARTTTPVSDDDERRQFAIAAYNAGEGRVAAAQREANAAGRDPRRFEHVEPFLPAITQRYVGRVLGFANASVGGS